MGCDLLQEAFQGGVGDFVPAGVSGVIRHRVFVRIPRDFSFYECRAGLVVRLGGQWVSAHLLISDRDVTLIDSGLVGMDRHLWRCLRALGRPREALRAVVLTHGHLDHAGCAAAIAEETGAAVWVPHGDVEHIRGRVAYRGAARVCGAMEWVGRWVFRYRVPSAFNTYQPGQVLPFWGGLRAWHLPGHTPGQCALVSEVGRVIFSADLFASYSSSVHVPPSFLNRDSKAARAHVANVARWNAAQENAYGIIPSHYDVLDPVLYARRLQALERRLAAPRASV